MSQTRKRQHEETDSDSDFESGDEIRSEEEIAEETPEEKRLRLAQIYLEELQRKGKRSLYPWHYRVVDRILEIWLQTFRCNEKVEAQKIFP